MSPTPHDIQTKEFREAFRGYHQEDVDEFLDEIAEDVTRLTQESQRMRVQVAALQQEIARMQEGGAPTMSFAPESKSDAREEAKRALEAAQSAAESLLHEARTQADRLIADAEKRAADAERRVVEAAASRPEPGSDETADVEARLKEMLAQEQEIRARLRGLLEEGITVLDRSDAQSHQAATVQRMSRELADGGEEPEPNPRRFWTEPTS